MIDYSELLAKGEGPWSVSGGKAIHVNSSRDADGDCLHSENAQQIRSPPGWKFNIGDRVRKISGSSWQGRVCGTYATTITPQGYCVESEREPGSVQIYPASALEKVED